MATFEKSKGIPMYRLFSPASGEHFYTANEKEKDYLSNVAGWKYEGIGWTAPEFGEPVYRVLDPATGLHHYTPNETERMYLIAHVWKDEGISWYGMKTE